MTDSELIVQAIQALEAQRATLGDAVVDAGLAPMREKLAALQSQVTPSEPRRKQVTVLFADISGFTALAERLDVEEVTALMNNLWVWLDGAITAHGGTIDKHIGDAVMALWGVAEAHEDDPEHAVHAALALQAALTSFAAQRQVPLSMRVGLHTGPVLLGLVGTTQEFTAMGDTVNLASRMEHAAPVGGILITHTTYRHVRGVFAVQPQPPLVVKGKTELIHTYLVQGVMPRALRMGTRSVEGIETHMVGRAVELLALQQAYTAAHDSGHPRLMLVVGEAGIGKSRLLYEFEQWIALRQVPVFCFKGRALPALQRVPYGILRDMFAARFGILESDSVATALTLFRAGMAAIMPPEHADLVGHLVGFDFAASPAVQHLVGSTELATLGRAYLIQSIRTLAHIQPLVILLEDLHWVDASTLDLLALLVADIPQAHLLVVALTRPSLFERHPQWGEPPAGWTHLALSFLSAHESRTLVDALLQKVEAVPPALRDLIVARTDGNPFFVEELIKMLLDTGVIVRGADDRPWQVQMDHLQQMSLPSTLTGILQARLDSLPQTEQRVLQCAAVVGRLFWGAAVATMAGVAVEGALEAVRVRELVFRRERSTFAATDEYIFKHALLRDVTYETVLLKSRCQYHAQVAHWLEAHAGDRLGEYAGLIAEHLERAGQAEQAVGYLRQAAERALEVGANHEALEIAQRALALLPEEHPARANLLVQVGEARLFLCDYATAHQQLTLALAIAQTTDAKNLCATALYFLGGIALEQGDFTQAREHMEASLALAYEVGDRARVALTLVGLSWVDIRQGAYQEAEVRLTESIAIGQALADRQLLARALGGLSVVAKLGWQDSERARNLAREALALAQAIGARGRVVILLINLGEAARLGGNYAEAERYCHEAIEVSKEIGDRFNVIVATTNLGHVVTALGDDSAARVSYHEALRMATAMAILPLMLENLAGLSGILARSGEVERALELVGLAATHPSLYDETRPLLEQTLDDLRAQISPEQIATGLERGRALNLDAVVQALMAT